MRKWRCCVSKFDCKCCDWRVADSNLISPGSVSGEGAAHGQHRTMFLLLRGDWSAVPVWSMVLCWPAPPCPPPWSVLSPLPSGLLRHGGTLPGGLAGHQAPGAGAVGHSRRHWSLCWQCPRVSGVRGQGGWQLSMSSLPGKTKDESQAIEAIKGHAYV